MSSIYSTEVCRLRRAVLVAARVESFLLFGTLGLGANMAGLWMLHGRLGVPLTTAALIALLASMASAFICNEVLTWGDFPRRSSFPGRTAIFFVINSVGMLINWHALLYLHQHQSLHYQMANVVGAAFAAVCNFTLNQLVVWRL